VHRKGNLQIREGRGEGRLNVSFDFFGDLADFFRIFLVIFQLFFLRTGVYRYLVEYVSIQALPDLWSPRVWFTFRQIEAAVSIEMRLLLIVLAF